MSEWQETPVRDLCRDIVDCINKTAPTVPYATQWKMLRTTNIRRGWVDTENVKFVEHETFERWTRRLRPRSGDVILTREAPLGEVGLLRSDDAVFLGQRLVLYRVDPERCDNRFLCYAMLGPEVQEQLRSLGSGATVEHLRVPDCETLTVRCPSLVEQRRIGAILGSLDDLIENNRQRIEILEEMARTIYREWFIHFRFPGHEHGEFVDSPIGSIPEGWPVRPASAIIDVNPRVLRDESTDHPFVTMGDLSERNSMCFPSERRSQRSGSKFQNGDTLFARITPCLENGKTGLVQGLDPNEAGRGSTEFIVLRGKKAGPAYTYLLARNEDFRAHAIKSMSGASGRQRVRNECFDSYFVAAPPAGIATAFEETVMPLYESAFHLALETASAGKLRDELLPKLVTGQIDVSHLDIDVARVPVP